MVETLITGLPVGLNSVRFPVVVLLWLTTQILPEASAATFCGSSSDVVPSVYRMPTVQSVGCVPTPVNGDVPVCNAYREARLVVGFRLMATAAPKVSVADVAPNSAVHAALDEPVVLTHAARILAMVFSLAVSGATVMLQPVQPPPVKGLVVAPATPVLMLTRLFTVANALARPVVFVLDVPIKGESVRMNCPRARAVAAVVTSLTVT